MAKPSFELISALRETARRLQNGAYYAWGHHGACNCGNLAQVITHFSKEEILRFSHTGIGEWTELAQEFCPVSGTPLTLMISRLEAAGLTPSDIHHIEYLSDKEVLRALSGGFRWLKRNKKEDAIAYFEAFANLLEEQLISQVDVSPEPVQAEYMLEEETLFA